MMNRSDRRKYAKKINTPQKLEMFSNQMNNQLRKEYQEIYEKRYQEDLGNAIDLFLLAIVYTLHYNEKTQFGNARIEDFMEDLFVTVDYFRTKEYNPEDYRKQLEEDGIKIITSKKGDNKNE